MNKPDLSICIPLRVTDAYRQRNWNVCAQELLNLIDRRVDLDIEVVVAEWDGVHAEGYSHITRMTGQGVFNRSRARNQAFQNSHADRICFLDSDMLLHPDAWDDAIRNSVEYDACSPYNRFQKLGKRKTINRCVDGKNWDWNLSIDTGEGGPVHPSKANLAGGIMFCSRHLIESIDGWDERFTGWGSEDTAVELLVIEGQYKIGFLDNNAIHLYHIPDRSGRDQTKQVMRESYRSKSMEVINESSIKYASHLPLLSWALSKLEPGRVAVEFGAGAYSSPAFKLFSDLNDLTVYSWESDQRWLDYAERQYGGSRFYVKDIRQGGINAAIAEMREIRPEMVFVDTGIIKAGETYRNHILQSFLPISRYVVCHDTEVESNRIYGYDFSSARYVRHFTLAGVRTTILSNTESSIRSSPTPF